MRTRATVGLFVSIWLGAGLAYGDTIGLYADTQGTNCNFVDNQPRLLQVHVVHISPGGATASEFSAPMPACMTGATYLSDTVWFAVGNSQVGISVGYGSCVTGSIYLMAINYFVRGTSEICCVYPVLPNPYAVPGGAVLVQDCDFNSVSGVGLAATVNGNSSCPCGGPVPVEETTWGRVKTLYEE
jgi:hypothetical protein